jgi:hypothetical protein
MSTHDLLLEVFCLVDDLLQDPCLPGRRSRGPDATLTDAEVITIEVVGEFLGFDADSRLFWFFRHYHKAEFPKLAQIHRTTFARQAANLWHLKQAVQHRLACWLAAADPVWLVDSMPMPVCRFGRGGYCRKFKGEAAFGYDSVQKQVYYGFRLHLRVSRDGVILAFALAAANVHDQEVVELLDPPAGTLGIGDRNYSAPLLGQQLAESGVRLLAPPRVKKTDPDPERSRCLSQVRWKVEEVNGHLAGRYNAKKIWARDAWHACHRLIRKVLSHTVAVWLNVTAGRPPLRFDDLLAA